MSYPAYTITSTMFKHALSLSESLVTHTDLDPSTVKLSPILQRKKLIDIIHATLAIENNTLTLEQVTDVLDGKTVIAPTSDIHKVRGAFEVYGQMDLWDPYDLNDLFDTHGIFMHSTLPRPDMLRTRGASVFSQRNRFIKKTESSHRIDGYLKNLFHWLQETDEHPLITACIMHYELELIHPFSDCNGCMGRFWQALILSKWKPLFAYLPVEPILHYRLDEYYAAISLADRQRDASPFIEFMLAILLDAIELLQSDSCRIQVFDYVSRQECDHVDIQCCDQDCEQVCIQEKTKHVSDQVECLLKLLLQGNKSASELMAALSLRHPPTFRKNYLNPALEKELIERTQPDKPRSPGQRYRLTTKGRSQVQAQ